MNKLVVSAAVCAVLLMSAGGLAPAVAESETGKEAKIAAGKIMFNHRCQSCHADDPARKAYGPSLVGIVGRKAGSLDGFEYSDAMKNSGIVWNAETLRAWIADNKGFLPGTRMRHVGIKDDAEQDFLIAYISSLK